MRLFLLCMLTTFSIHSYSADVPTGTAPEWMKLTVPGEGHKALTDFVGKWKFTMSMWMGPSGKAETSSGTSTNKWIMDGRFVQQDVKSKMNGQTFTGLGITGFDSMRQEYQTVWLDNMATNMMLGTGSLDTQTQVLNTKGDFACAMTGNKNRTYRAELKKVSKNEHTYTMFTTDTEGKEFKGMEIVYKRVN